MIYTIVNQELYGDGILAIPNEVDKIMEDNHMKFQTITTD